ncbi:MAG: hypothetical protein WB994_08350 [Candidatus Acidiferrum sp.]
MPLYWFHIDVPTQPQVLNDRLKSIVRDEPGMKEYLRRAWTSRVPDGPPFLGNFEGNSFAIRRDIGYRNSFLPRIRGRINPTLTGARVSVIMWLHPFTALFMAFWLGFIGHGALRDNSASSLLLWVMFAFGVSLALGAFFPEALKAKRLLSTALLNTSGDSTKELRQR